MNFSIYNKKSRLLRIKAWNKADGIDRTIARNQNLTASKITNAQPHNEREKESYTNPDIVPERLDWNVHYKTPTGSYAEMFEQMKADGVISTRGLKDDRLHRSRERGCW